MVERSIKALLFSDIKSFSKMSEKECLIFCENFHLGVQKNVLSQFEDKIILKNTWGDALHLVFDDIETAGTVALKLRDWVANFDWEKAGLKNKLQIRIALHAGVVSKVPDPIIEKFNYVGKNTSKAARIEPITFEGQVFVSEAYAALLSSLQSSILTCEYVGMKELPKQAGITKVYLLDYK